MSSFQYKAPALLLRELGITEPEDIHIEAIAQYCGATIRYENLTGCEARILGLNDKAIITVKKDSPRERQRFSAGHELGHWMRDRGKIAFACEAKTFAREWSADNPERRANQYAAELLLPEPMFTLRARSREITFASVEELTAAFQTSLTATAIRLVELGSFPAMIVCYSREKRHWFFRGPDVPTALWPLEHPENETLASRLLNSLPVSAKPTRISADAWIKHPESWQYSLIEDSRLLVAGLVISLLWWKDERQLLDLMNEDEE